MQPLGAELLNKLYNNTRDKDANYANNAKKIRTRVYYNICYVNARAF